MAIPSPNIDVDPIREALKALAGVLDKNLSPLKKITTVIEAIGKITITSTQKIAEFTSKINSAGVALLRFPINVLDSAISSMQIGIARFVALADPAAFNLFKLAVDDLYASIGRALVPVMHAATAVVRSVANAIIGLNGDGKKVLAFIAGGTVALVTFGVAMGGVIAITGVSTAGVLAFAAAMAVVEAVATGGIGPILSAIGYSLGAIGVAGASLGSVLAAVAGGVVGLFAAFGDFGPILKDASALLSGFMEALGAELKNLMPLAQPLITFLGQFAGFFGRMIIFSAKLVSALEPVLTLIGNLTNGILSQLMPIIDLLAEGAIVTLVAAIAGVAAAAALAAAPFIALGLAIKGILDFLGIKIPQIAIPKGKPGESTGAAVRSTSTGDVSDVLRKARESAFSIGGSKGPQDRTADNTENIANGVLGLQNYLEQLPQKVWEKFKDIPDHIAKKLKELLPNGKEAKEFIAKSQTNSGAFAGGIAGTVVGGPVGGAAGRLFGGIVSEGYDRARKLFD